MRGGQALGKKDHERWLAILNDQGWLASGWPRAFGGAEWNAVQKHIFEEEAAGGYAPRIVPFGLSMLAPVVQKIGSTAQQEYWLPRILSGADLWCQGYSEPMLGQHANMIFCPVCADRNVKQQDGISFRLVDRDTPVSEVRLLVEARHLNRNGALQGGILAMLLDAAAGCHLAGDG